MKFKHIPFVSLILLNSYTASSTEQFQYIELTKVNLSVDEGSNADGFGVEGKIKISDYFYANAAFQRYGVQDVEVNRAAFGLGTKYEFNTFLIPFAQIDYMNVDSKFKSDDYSMKQYRFGVGFAGSLDNIQYKLGVSRYTVNEKEVKDETTKFVESFYLINNSFSVGAKAEFTDGATMYSLGLRYQF